MNDEQVAILCVVIIVSLFIFLVAALIWIYVWVRLTNPELYVKLTTPSGGHRKSPLQLEKETVLKTRYIKDDYRGVRETVSTSSAIGRSLVGGAIGGDLGAIIGAGTARTKTVGQPKAVFIVWYKDGTDAVKTVKMNSPYYDLYLSKLER